MIFSSELLAQDNVPYSVVANELVRGLPKPATERACTWIKTRLAFWEGRVPNTVAQAQVAWERMRDIERMRALNLTLRDIGEQLGICTATVALQLERLARLKKQNKGLGISPVERYLALPLNTKEFEPKTTPDESSDLPPHIDELAKMMRQFTGKMGQASYGVASRNAATKQQTIQQAYTVLREWCEKHNLQLRWPEEADAPSV